MTQLLLRCLGNFGKGSWPERCTIHIAKIKHFNCCATWGWNLPFSWQPRDSSADRCEWMDTDVDTVALVSQDSASLIRYHSCLPLLMSLPSSPLFQVGSPFLYFWAQPFPLPLVSPASGTHFVAGSLACQGLDQVRNTCWQHFGKSPELQPPLHPFS